MAWSKYNGCERGMNGTIRDFPATSLFGPYRSLLGALHFPARFATTPRNSLHTRPKSASSGFADENSLPSGNFP
jgi:hypothetical protein